MSVLYKACLYLKPTDKTCGPLMSAFPWIILLITVLIFLYLLYTTKKVRAKVYVTCFTGRKHNMEILTRYIDKLISTNSIDEFHMWDFTKTESDAEYIRTLMNKKGYSLIVPYTKTIWSDYYTHYANMKLNPDDVIIKLDDDILFIDTQQFDAFISKRRSYKNNIIMFPNIINNGVCAHLQYNYNLMPFDLPYDTYYGKLVENGTIANQVHEHFISNHQSITQKARSISEDYTVPIGDRVSINFMSILGKDIQYYRDVIGDDEENIRKLSILYNKNHVIDLSTIVVHGAFGTQRKTGLDEQKIIEGYAKI